MKTRRNDTKEKINWVDIWFNDKSLIVSTMLGNMQADVEAGYDPDGYTIQKQRVDIETYRREFDREAKKLRDMEPMRAQHWCYCDLKRRGAI